MASNTSLTAAHARRVFAIVSAVAGAGVAAFACNDLPDVVPECGNDVVEPKLQEDCDEHAVESTLPTGDPTRKARCAKPPDPNACHYVVDAMHACPLGYRAGKSASDPVCRRPSGTFDAPSDPISGIRGYSPQVADLDGDGQLDLVLATSGVSLPFYLARNGAHYAATPAPPEPGGAAAADFTGDGIADVASAAPDGSGIVIRKHNPDRTDESHFYPDRQYPGQLRYAWGPFTYSDTNASVAWGSDLVAIYADPTASGCNASVCARNETKGWMPQPLPWLQANQIALVTSATGSSGMVVGVAGAQEVRFGTTAQQLVNSPSVIPLPGALAPGSLTLRDYDGDHIEDLGGAVCTTSTGFFSLTGPSTAWSPPPTVAPFATGSSSFFTCAPSGGGPALAFLDADSYPDAIFDTMNGQGWQTKLSGGTKLSGAFTNDAFGFLSMPYNCASYAVGDVNGDGRDDVAFACVSGVLLVLGSDPPFTPHFTLTGAPVKQIVIADVDGDGIGDIVTAVGSTNSADCGGPPDEVFVSYGRSSGFPEPPVRIGRLPGVEQLVAGHADARKHGKLVDIAVSSQCPASGAVGAVIRGDDHRRPFTSFIHHETNFDFFAPNLVFAGDAGLATSVSAPASLVALGQEVSEVAQSPQALLGLVIPVGSDAAIDGLVRTFVPPVTAFPAGDLIVQAFAPDAGHPGRFFLGGDDIDFVGTKHEPLGEALRISAMQVDSASPTDERSLPGVVVNATGYVPLIRWSMATIDSQGVTALAVATGDFADAEPGFNILHLDGAGRFRDSDPVSFDLPSGSHYFVGVVALEGKGLAKEFLVATDASVFSVDESARTLTPIKAFAGDLAGNGITAIAVGDFSGDGLDDLLIVDKDGGRVIAQTPLRSDQ